MNTSLLGKLAVFNICILSLIFIKPYMGLNFTKTPQVKGIDTSKDLATTSIEESLRPRILVASEQTKKPISKPLPKPTPSPTPEKPIQPAIVSGGEVIALIERYASQYGVNKEMMITIARCESGLNPNANGKGIYGGIYQFLASTWSSNRRAMGLDPNPQLRFNPEEAVKTAAFKMSRDGFGAWPVCSRKITKV